MSDRIGYLKLYRKTVDSDFWVDPDPFSLRDAFIHVLLAANWREGISRRNGHKVVINRGQWLTSIRKLMETFHWSKNRVYRWLKTMRDYEMLESENLGFGTLLTVVNYDKYQISPDGNGHTDGHTNEDTHGHTDGHEVGTRSKNNKEGRTQKEESLSAHAGPPPAETIEPPRGSPKWYALHNDD